MNAKALRAAPALLTIIEIGDDMDLQHHHGAISVPDLAASINWWRETLGFEVEARVTIAQIPAEVAMMRRGNLRIELFEVPGAKSLPDDRRSPLLDVQTHGNKHVAFAVPRADLALAELRAKGAEIVMVVQEDFGSAVFIHDNAGNLVEFVQDPNLFSE